LLLMGKNADALAEAVKETEEVSRLLDFALVYWAMDRRSDADMALRQLESKYADVAAYDIGAIHAYRGEADAAVTWLERAYGQRGDGMVFLKVDPRLRNLRSDARYKALVRKMNLPD
jgi:hypothetical protein